MQSDGVSDVYLDVALILAKWRNVLLLEVFLLVGYLTKLCLYIKEFCGGVNIRKKIVLKKAFVGQHLKSSLMQPIFWLVHENNFTTNYFHGKRL